MHIRTGTNAKVLRKAIIPLLFTQLAYSATEQTTAYTYHPVGSNGAGQLASIDGPRVGNGDTTSFGYDTAGNLVSITDPLGHVISLSEFTPRQLPGKVTDINGVETLLSYTSRGWLASSAVIDPSGTSPNAVTTFDYDQVGQVVRVTLPDQSYLDFEYDDARRLVAIENSALERIEYTLDVAGNRTSEKIRNSSGAIVRSKSRVFNTLSRLTKEVGAYNQETQYTYDGNANLVGTTDAKGNSTSFAFDALNRLVEEAEPNAFEVTYSYDGQNRIEAVTDQRGLVTSYSYDAFSNLVSVQSPDTGTAVFAYDNAGNRIQSEDARGIIAHYSYDNLNRLTAITYPSSTSENVIFEYDSVAGGSFGKGRLTKIIDESGQVNYRYDYRGNIIQKNYTIDGVSYSVSYTYDLADKLTQIVYPSGRVVDIGRNALGKIVNIDTKESVNDTAVAVISNVSYHPYGPVSSYQFGNGLIRDADYDQDYRVSALETYGSNTLQSLNYSYDLNSNISSIGDQNNSALNQAFAYDDLDRLESAAGGYGQINYLYDGVGNRTGRAVTNVTTDETYTYSPSKNQLDQVVIDDGASQVQRSFGYDANGNMILDARPDGTFFNLVYNAANRLSLVEKNASPLAAYLYNVLGQRVAKTVITPSGTIADHYHFDQEGRLISVTAENGDVKREYIFLEDERVAVLVNDVYANQ